MLLVTETSELHRRATLINQALLVSAVEQQEIVEVTKASADQLSSSIVQKEQELDRTKEELRSLASQLLQAQEDERRRIARELNDSFSQQLAYLGIQMFHLKQEVSSDAGHMLVAKIQSQLEGLANEVRALSHQLHPHALEHLGLVTSLRALLDDFESNHSIAINLLAHELTAPIPLQTATTLYRIVQESLWNVVRHFCMQTNSVLAPPITQLETSVRAAVQFPCLLAFSFHRFAPDEQHPSTKPNRLECRYEPSSKKIRCEEPPLSPCGKAPYLT